jgi:thiazole/oxazole-forming peptide maturase SagD family component
MKSFVDPRIAFLTKVLNLFPKDALSPVEHTNGVSTYFERKVSDFFRQRPHIVENKLPGAEEVYCARVIIACDGVRLGSFGTSHSREEALLYSQAEFLERVSSWLPLESARKADFSVRKTKAKEKELIKSLLGLRSASSKPETLYWGLAKTKGAKGQVTTSGIAGHFDKTQATVSAWLELLERDAFLVHWLTAISPKRIDLSSTGNEAELSRLLLDIKQLGYEYYLLDITSDIAVPVCLAIVVADTPDGKKVGMGARAGFNVEDIALRAFSEALVVLDSVATTEAATLPKDFIAFSDERIDKNMRIRLSLSKEGFSRLSFLFSSKQVVSYKDFGRITAPAEVLNSARVQLSYLKSLFKERYKKDRRYDVFTYSFKNTLTKLFDFHVIRVICNALYPMYLNEQFADPNHPRLREFTKNKGLEDIAKLNTWPHPFP